MRSMSCVVSQAIVVGVVRVLCCRVRVLQPSEADPAPQIYRMRIFANNEVKAKSRFWCVWPDWPLLSGLCGLGRTGGSGHVGMDDVRSEEYIFDVFAFCPIFLALFGGVERSIGFPRPLPVRSHQSVETREFVGIPLHFIYLHVRFFSSRRYFLTMMKKMKRATGEILAVHEIRERNHNTVRNYGITIRYNSRSGTHNMYKEYRDVSLTGAVEQMYQELAGRHRARFSNIHIVDTTTVPAGLRATKKYHPDLHGPVPPPAVKRPGVKQFLDSKISFPLPHRLPRPSSKKYRTTFKANRPTTFFS